jgi:hypothetical protein
VPDRNPQEQVVLSREELEALVKRTVNETLTSIGLDHKNPIELQKDFQSLREWRQAMQEVRKKTLITLIGILVTGLAAAIWIGLKSMFSP